MGGALLEGLELCEPCSLFAKRTYPQVIRLTPIKKLGWHGRSTPASVVQAAGVVASQRITSIAEPIRVAVRGLFGEPMGRVVPAI